VSAPTATARPDGGDLARPPAATGRGSLLAAELGRLRRRRLVLTLVGLALAALVVGMAAVFATHSTDFAGARAKAARQAQAQAAGQREAEAACRQDPSIPEAERAEACDFGGGPAAEDLYVDPRFFAETGLPVVVVAVGVAGALVAALVGATAVGADWSSRAIITLLTWEPRRLRLLGTRLLAIALGTAALGLLAQALALGLGALTVQLRGSWGAPPGGVGDGGSALLPHATFWRDLLSLQLRGVVLMVLAALLAASVTSITRHTGGLLGLMFAWFAVAENAVRALAGDRGWSRWLITENILAFLVPGGQHLPAGTRITADGVQPSTVLVSNLDALLYLVLLTAAAGLLAGVLLRRRDL
jgi:ABC-type transport system involved in multi-copper enzyme maturation permease subunit